MTVCIDRVFFTLNKISTHLTTFDRKKAKKNQRKLLSINFEDDATSMPLVESKKMK